MSCVGTAPHSSRFVPFALFALFAPTRTQRSMKQSGVLRAAFPLEHG